MGFSLLDQLNCLMKLMPKIQISILLTVLTFFILSCENDEVSECIEGKVIGYDPCYNVTLIQVISGNLKGGPISLLEHEFENVVQYPNAPNSTEYPPLEVSSDSILYFNYRYYDSETDEYPVYEDICPAIYEPFTVPLIVITKYSTTHCPL